MAADLIGELGLDVAEIQKALGSVIKQLDGLQNAANKSNQSVGKIEKGFTGLVSGAKQLGVAFGIAFSVKAIVDYVKSFKDLHGEIQKTRSSLAEGSVEAKNFAAATNSVQGGEAAGIGFKRVSEKIENFATNFKEKAANMMEQTVEGMSRNPNPLVGDNRTAKTKEIDKAREYNQETVDRGKKIVELQHEVVEARGQDMSIQRNQLAALDKEAKLQFEIMEYASRTGIADEAMRSGAVQARAAALTAHKTLKLQMENELRAAAATTREIILQNQGMSGAAKETEIMAKFQERIAVATNAGRFDLVAQLQTQQKLALASVAVGEHNMSPAQRRDERRAARKLLRDTKKTNAHEKDLESRLTNAYFHPETITKGSELDRYRTRRMKAAQGLTDDKSTAGESAAAEKYFIQGLADLDAIKSNTAGITKNR